jgi:hypothetical protein
VLFLQHEQYKWFWEEPGHLELYLPMVNSGLLGEVRSHPYQREVRWAIHKANQRAQAQPMTPVEIETIAQNGLALALDAVIGEFRPDLVVYALTWPQESVPGRILQALKDTHQFKLFSVIWDYDEANQTLMNCDKSIIAVSDLVAVADSWARADRIRRREGLYADFTNVEAVRFMPMVADPAMFHPSPIKRFDVTVAGSSEGQRVEIYEKLVAVGIRVNRVGGLMPDDIYLPHAEYARALAESRIVVNTQTRGERIQLKGRVSQVLASGALLMEQWSPESERFLGNLGLSALMWRNVDELVSMIRGWLERPAECDAFATDARARFISAHNPQSWTASILEDIGLSCAQDALEPPPAV